MKLLKAKQSHPKKITIKISDLAYIKTMTPLKELLEGEELQNPIEVRKYEIIEDNKYGVGGVIAEQKPYHCWKGSQRVQAALKLGYTHIEGIIINE